MKMAEHFPISAIVLLFIMMNHQVFSCPVVTTQYGDVRGKSVSTGPGHGVDIFLGIRYAAPPIGPLRFAPPTPPDKWTSVKNTTRHGARCLGRVISEDPVTPNVPYSEDCLFLDVYSPWSASSDPQLPVMMYIHGGGFYGGTGALYNFTNVAAKGVVVVAINYRLDVFGFLSTGDVTIPGNFGLLDQVFALQWVKTNIRAFRGNPDDVTLFGGSAGAASVSLLAVSPLTRGTFQKAIMQSGVSLAPWAVRESHSQSLKIAQTLGQALDCDVSTTAALRSCMRGLSADDVINASVALQMTTQAMQWVPVLDGSFLPDTPLNLITKDPGVKSIPTIRGYNRDDLSYFINDTENTGLTVKEFYFYVKVVVGGRKYTDNVDTIMSRVIQEYLKKPPSQVAPKELRAAAIRIVTDALLVAPTAAEAKLFSDRRGGQDSYMYEFAYVSSLSQYPAWKGVIHTEEKGFVLGLPRGPDPFSFENADDQDRRVSDLVTTLWTNLAKYGAPTPSSVNNTVWQPYATAAGCHSHSKPPQDYQGQIYVIKEGPEVRPFDRAGKVLFWEKTLPDFYQSLSSHDVTTPAPARLPDEGLKEQISNFVLIGFKKFKTALENVIKVESIDTWLPINILS